MKGRLFVLDGGLFTTVQDAGRPGLRKYGIPASGVMDEMAYSLANYLVGNQQGAPVLECTMKGGKFKFESEALIAITGAQMPILLNGKQQGLNKTMVVSAGDLLELGYADRGCRAYMGIHGEWHLNSVLQSYSTYALAGFGGLEGRSLRKGDTLEWEDGGFREEREVPRKWIPYYSNKIKVRVIEGPEWNALSESTKEQFLNTEFIVLSQSDRMGIRLETEGGVESTQGQIISSATVPGTIQLTSSGQPIILMKDGQTTGGYPRLGTVIESELHRLSQLLPGNKVQFKLVEFEEAVEMQAYHKNLLEDIIT